MRRRSLSWACSSARQVLAPLLQSGGVHRLRRPARTQEPRHPSKKAIAQVRPTLKANKTTSTLRRRLNLSVSEGRLNQIRNTGPSVTLPSVLAMYQFPQDVQ